MNVLEHSAMVKKRMTSQNTPYQKAKQKILQRNNTINGEEITLEQGVNFFVEALERAGAKVRFTCEGHPRGFNVVFTSPYELAFNVQKTGYFCIRMTSQRDTWHMNLQANEQAKKRFTANDRDELLAFASIAWEKSNWFIHEA